MRRTPPHLSLLRFPAILLLMVATAVSPMTAQQDAGVPQIVAMVTGVQGDAVRTIDGRDAPVAIGEELPRGAVIASRAGSVSLVFLSGVFVEVDGGETLTLGDAPESSTLNDGTRSRGLTAQEAVTVADGGVERQDTERRWQAQLTRMYGIRGDASTVAVSPRLLVSGAPVLVFFDADSTRSGTRSYTVTVRSDAGSTVFEKTVTAQPMTFVSVPVPQFPIRAEARFTWSVMPVDAPSSRGEAAFVCADAETMRLADRKRASVASLVSAGTVDATSQHMLLALHFLDERERLFSDAVPHLLALREQPAAADYARKQLALVLGRFGNQTGALAARLAASTR